MRDVYSQASLTILAGASCDSNGRLFRRKCARLQVNPRSDKTGFWRLEASQDHECVHPIRNRAWTYQEELLSIRTLIYSVNQITWECKTVHVRQKADFPHSYPFVNREDSTMIPRIPWQKIVEDFSKRKLTISQDRLPALSAIAKEYAIESNDRHLAGIWESSLSNGLSWRGYSRTQNRYSQDYIAPLWSWASYNGGVCLNITGIFYEPLMKSTYVPSTTFPTAHLVLSQEVIWCLRHLFDNLNLTNGKWSLLQNSNSNALSYDRMSFGRTRQATRVLTRI